MYTFKIEPIKDRSMRPLSNFPTKIVPLYHHSQVGRPKKKRQKTQDDIFNQTMVKSNKVSKKLQTMNLFQI